MAKEYYSNPEETLPYDLRQIYAINLVGEHLQDVARARKGDDYPNYFKCLKDLWVITQHKIKAKNKDAIEEWENLLKKATKVINENSQTFRKKTKNPKGVYLIESVLNELEMFLYDKLEEAKIFGSKWEDEGL